MTARTSAPTVLTHCQIEPEIFFSTSTKDRDRAIAACEVCLLQEPCLEDVMRAEKGTGASARHGVYGGVTASGRHKLEKTREAEAKAAS